MLNKNSVINDKKKLIDAIFSVKDNLEWAKSISSVFDLTIDKIVEISLKTNDIYHNANDNLDVLNTLKHIYSGNELLFSVSQLTFMIGIDVGIKTGIDMCKENIVLGVNNLLIANKAGGN